MVTLYSLLDRTRRRKCTNPRDKIYSLLGIVDCGASISPDYSKSVEEVFTDTARIMIREYQHLGILSHAGYRERQPGIPTWAPTWGNRGCVSLRLRDGNGRARYRAASKTVPSVIYDGDTKYVLKLRGLRVDRVAAVYFAFTLLKEQREKDTIPSAAEMYSIRFGAEGSKLISPHQFVERNHHEFVETTAK